VLDTFTQRRLLKLLTTFKKQHGRDPNQKDILAAGFTEEQLKEAVRTGVANKYQVTTGSGSIENRYNSKPDWRSLNV